MPVEFVIIRNGEEEGPFTEEEILDLLDEGLIDRNDQCRQKSGKRVRPLGEVFTVIRSPAPPSRQMDPEPIREPAPERPPQPIPQPTQTEPSVKWAPSDPIEEMAQMEQEEALSDARKIIYQGHPSILTYWKMLVAGALCAVVGIFAGDFSGWFTAMGVFACVLTVLFALVDRSCTDYIVTSRRVEIIYGLISKSSKEVRIEDIRAINVEKPGLLGLLGIGTVEFASAGTDEMDVAFKTVWGAHKVKKLVRKVQDERAD